MEMLTYKIVSGDNLSKISKKLNISTDTLKIYNSSARKGRFIVNKELTYPSKDGVLYKIKRGDSIPKIAKLYQIKEEDIISNNKINPKKLVAGKKIFLPKVSYKRFNELKNNKTSKVSKTKKTKNNKKNKSNKKIQVSGKSSYGFSFPIKYRGINSRFGYRLHPVLRRYILHTGVDLVAKYVPLRAAKDGVVSYAGWMRGYGKIIIIKHSNNYETRYAHLSVIS
ncbi:MAG: peptidase M23, partial [Fusobacteriales bacterium]